ncbi:MAG: type II toxin-antitoxin system VapC family toxin [Candidatus Omnitrophica bacterium]|nr:type II toxin-antitoxin system VapC family toxin [Candidatus Omnitrophota bacterium]
MEIIRVHFLDTSALIKLIVKEEGSGPIRDYFKNHSNFYTTAICFAETLGVLKTKCFYSNVISEKEYFSASYLLLAYLRNNSLSIKGDDIWDVNVYQEVEFLSKQYSLDISDAFQLCTMKRGIFGKLLGESQPILITADKNLAKAARAEGLKAWDCLCETLLSE